LSGIPFGYSPSINAGLIRGREHTVFAAEVTK
jgi:hypothetical protein